MKIKARSKHKEHMAQNARMAKAWQHKEQQLPAISIFIWHA